MAVRRRVLRPDTVLNTDSYGPIPVVSDDAFLGAVLQAAQVQILAGGYLSSAVQRHPTDAEHEMVTVGAVIEWRDRTDARPQPERAAPLPAQTAAPEPAPEPEPSMRDEDDAAVAAELDDRINDGLDPASLEDEDLESIPAQLR